MNIKLLLLDCFHEMTEGETPPEDSNLDKVISKYGEDRLREMVEGVFNSDSEAEKLWSEVRWELID
jgi:hypothetical protein